MWINAGMRIRNVAEAACISKLNYVCLWDCAAVHRMHKSYIYNRIFSSALTNIQTLARRTYPSCHIRIGPPVWFNQPRCRQKCYNNNYTSHRWCTHLISPSSCTYSAINESLWAQRVLIRVHHIHMTWFCDVQQQNEPRPRKMNGFECK